MNRSAFDRFCQLCSLVSAALLFATAAASSAFAQSAALQDSWRQASDLVDAGRYSEAEPFARRSVEIARAESREESPQFERSITLLARVLQVEDRYDEAEALFRHALEIREHVLGPTDPKVAPSVYNLAVLLRWRGRLPEAEPLARRALTLRERGPEDANLADSLNELGNVLQDQGKYKAQFARRF